MTKLLLDGVSNHVVNNLDLSITREVRQIILCVVKQQVQTLANGDDYNGCLMQRFVKNTKYFYTLLEKKKYLNVYIPQALHSAYIQYHNINNAEFPLTNASMVILIEEYFEEFKTKYNSEVNQFINENNINDSTAIHLKSILLFINEFDIVADLTEYIKDDYRNQSREKQMILFKVIRRLVADIEDRLLITLYVNGKKRVKLEKLALKKIPFKKCAEALAFLYLLHNKTTDTKSFMAFVKEHREAVLNHKKNNTEKLSRYFEVLSEVPQVGELYIEKFLNKIFFENLLPFNLDDKDFYNDKTIQNEIIKKIKIEEQKFIDLIKPKEKNITQQKRRLIIKQILYFNCFDNDKFCQSKTIFYILFYLFQNKMYLVANRILKDPNMASSIVNELTIKVKTKLCEKNIMNVNSYLGKIVSRKAIKVINKHDKTIELKQQLSQLQSVYSNDFDDFALEVNTFIKNELLNKLTERQDNLFKFFSCLGYSKEQISILLDISISTFYRDKKTIKKIIKIELSLANYSYTWLKTIANSKRKKKLIKLILNIRKFKDILPSLDEGIC